jgi:hypothetical protein
VVLRHEQENAGRGGIFKIVYACWWVKNTEGGLVPLQKFLQNDHVARFVVI